MGDPLYFEQPNEPQHACYSYNVVTAPNHIDWLVIEQRYFSIWEGRGRDRIADASIMVNGRLARIVRFDEGRGENDAG